MVAYRFGTTAGAVAAVVAILLPAIAWRPLLGVYAGILVVPLDFNQIPLGELNFSPSELIFLVTAASTAVHFVLARQPPALDAAHIAFAGLVAVAATGVFFAEDALTTGKITLYWLAFLLVCILVSRSSREELERVLACVAITGGILGVLAMTGASDIEVQAGGRLATNRAQAIFAHPNVLAFFLILSIGPALALAGRGARARRVLMVACAAAAIGGITLTLARGGIVGAAVSLVVLMAWPPFRRIAIPLLAVLAIAVTFNFNSIQDAKEVTLVRERLSTITTPGGVQENTRFGIWRRSLPMVGERPWLGVGEGNYSEASPGFGLLDIGGVHYDHAHNILLTIAIETGLLGLALFLLFLWAAARAALRALRAQRSPVFPLALGMTAALCGLLVTSIGEYPPRTNAILAVIMVEVGGLIACARLVRDDGASARAQEPPKRPAVGRGSGQNRLPPGPPGPPVRRPVRTG
jgi:O-antigen ligase